MDRELELVKIKQKLLNLAAELEKAHRHTDVIPGAQVIVLSDDYANLISLNCREWSEKI